MVERRAYYEDSVVTARVVTGKLLISGTQDITLLSNFNKTHTMKHRSVLFTNLIQGKSDG